MIRLGTVSLFPEIVCGRTQRKTQHKWAVVKHAIERGMHRARCQARMLTCFLFSISDFRAEKKLLVFLWQTELKPNLRTGQAPFIS